MPFDRNGIWTLPVETDHSAFRAKIMSKRQEVAPTQEMIQAIAANLPVEAPAVSNVDVFNTIGKLKGKVDIVIPIYDGLHVLKPCIESIVKRTEWNYKLILVDDCSPDPQVKQYLGSLQDLYPDLEFKVIENKTNLGFAATVNRGVDQGYNDYVCILNSDTLVTREWLVRQLMALEDDERNVIVNPATNNTALINVPMYNGSSYIDMADAVAKAGNTPTYNEIMPTGFCFTLRRSTWEEIGPFDEAYISYGEESDLWFKAIKQTDENGVLLRNRAVIADNAYVFHERGTSFSQLGDDEHMGLRRSGSERFRELHPDFHSWQQGFKVNNTVDHLRNKLPREAFKKNYQGNVAFVVKSAAPCGGMNFIADIVNTLIEQGFNAKICVVPDNYDEETTNLQVVGNLRTAPILFRSHDEFTSTFTQRVFGSGKVYAAVTEITPIVWDLDQAFKGIEGYNFVQSYDPELAELSNRPELVEPFKQSYQKLPNICASNWVAEKLKKDGCEVRKVVLPGVNEDLFHYRDRSIGDERFTVAVLVNETYPFKGAKWAYEFIKDLQPETYPAEMRVLAIGPKALKDIRGVTCLGSLSQAKMAKLLGTEVDVLVDPSETHSYGMPALEAIASGCLVLTRNNRGIYEYEEAHDDQVSVAATLEEAVGHVQEVMRAEGSIEERVASREALAYSNILPESVRRSVQVQSFIDTLSPEKKKAGRNIEVITPHLRKHGGPTTIISTARQLQASGHNVGMSTIYTDWSPEVLNMAKHIKVRTNWQEVPDEVEALVINSDNPFAPQLFEKFPEKKFIMLKLSHNERFLAIENSNLNLPWDHIMTSTEWLRQACLNPMGEQWNHKAWDTNKVTTVGWYHYGHEIFKMPPTNRTYGTAQSGFRLGALIHNHPLKGSSEALAVIGALKRKYEANIHAVGFGEIRVNQIPAHMQYFQNASREDMAHAFQQVDVWFGASHTEGLGRMALEAMSAGCLVVTTDTGAEFLKDGENCLLYPVGDPQAGAELVSKAVEDQELFTKLIVNGYNTAETSANPSRFRTNLNNVVTAVMEEGALDEPNS